MKTNLHSYIPPLKVAILFLGCALIIALSILIGLGYFNYQLLIGGVLILAVVSALIAGRTGISAGFVIWILFFCIGIREVRITTNLGIHPLLILIFALLALVLIHEAVYKNKDIYWSIPRLMGIFSLFWIWGWVAGLENGNHKDVMLSEFLNFLILIPIFLVSAYVLRNDREWRRSVTVFFIAGVVIAFLGATESRLSGLQSWLPGFLNPWSFKISLTAEGFARAPFAFFDTSIATIICALSLPMLLPLWNWYRQLMPRIFLLIGAAIQLYGIYISATRAAWLMVLVALSLTLALRVLRRNPVIAILSIAILILGYRFVLPVQAINRFNSVTSTLIGSERETSVIVRQERYQDAWQMALEKPLGSGWGASGWVASDFIQITANLGMAAGLLFVVCYIASLWRIWRLSRTYPDDPLVFALFLCFVCVGINLAIDGVEVLTVFVAPVWFAWAMVEIRCRQLSMRDPMQEVPGGG